MAITMGLEAASFLRACESVHLLLEQRTLRPDDRDLIELSAIDLLHKLKSVA